MGGKEQYRAGRESWAYLPRVFLLLISLLVAVEGTTGPIDSKSAADPAPFTIGERLVYDVVWSPPWYLFFLPTMDAGEAELFMAGETQYKARKALRIVFKARSSGNLASMAGVKVDDDFEFFTDPETLCTLGATKKIREGKRKRDIEVRYLPETRRLHFSEVDVAVTPPVIKKDEYREDIPECVKDLFSALYALRMKNLSEGVSQKTVVGDNMDVKEVISRVDKKEVVSTPAGKFETWRMDTVALLGGLFKGGGQFRMWLTADSRKMPVQFEAKVSLGKVVGKLKQVEN